MMNGIINIYKEKGFTSFDVVAKLRGILKTRKIGHTGTLDPDAEGVLPVCVGKATKICELLTDKTKEYEAVMLLGRTTDTQDVTGETLTQQEVRCSAKEVEKAVLSFAGDYMQVPPMYSAIKINGQKLYDLARQGREVERKPRSVTFYELELLEQVSETDFLLRCLCSKGTYIRTLCHDIGQALGCGGCMSSLRRTMAAGFTLAECRTIEEVQQQGESLLAATDSLFRQYPAYRILSEQTDRRCRCGNPLTAEGLQPGLYRVYGTDGTFLCLSRWENGVLTSEKNFFGA